MGERLGLGGTGQTQAILLGARVRTLMRADPAGAVFLYAYPRKEAAAGARLAVGSDVVLLERPDRRCVVLHDDALCSPCRQHGCGVLVYVAAVGGDREIDLDGVVGRARLEHSATLGVDHVVGRGGDILQPAGLLECVMQRLERLYLSHAAEPTDQSRRRSSPRAGHECPLSAVGRPALHSLIRGAWRSLVARLLWEQEVPGSNPGAPIQRIACKSAGSYGFTRTHMRPNMCSRVHFGCKIRRSRRPVCKSPTLRTLFARGRSFRA